MPFGSENSEGGESRGFNRDRSQGAPYERRSYGGGGGYGGGGYGGGYGGGRSFNRGYGGGGYGNRQQSENRDYIDKGDSNTESTPSSSESTDTSTTTDAASAENSGNIKSKRNRRKVCDSNKGLSFYQCITFRIGEGRKASAKRKRKRKFSTIWFTSSREDLDTV